ncbi:MAG: hypothetical protein J6A47_07505 [Bacilli bacterium]|nr:hypothetical protein [Bacilli bacterium]MBO6286293.1 hypothetical protein [Bacilli bacterium]
MPPSERKKNKTIRKLITEGKMESGPNGKWRLAPIYDIPFGILCLLSYKFLRLLCQVFLGVTLYPGEYEVIPQRRFASFEGGFVALDAALTLLIDSFIDIEMFTGKLTVHQVIRKLERYVTMVLANRKWKKGLPTGRCYVLAFLSHPSTKLFDKDGNEVSILRYHHERAGGVEGETIPFEFVLVNVRAFHEDPLIREICHDLLLDDPEQMHNSVIKNAYKAFITNKEVKKAMCKRDKENVKLGEKKGLEKGEKIGIEKGKKIGIERDRDRVIRSCIEIGLPAEQICIVGDITREQLEAKYNY